MLRSMCKIALLLLVAAMCCAERHDELSAGVESAAVKQALRHAALRNGLLKRAHDFGWKRKRSFDADVDSDLDARLLDLDV